MKKSKIIFGIVLIAIISLILYFVFRPSKVDKTEISHNMIVNQIEELGRLELLRYNISDVVEYKKIRNWLPNSKTILLVVGEVTACVDLQKMTAEDIVVNSDSISLLLPPPEICHFKIDHNRSCIYDVQFGLWETTELVDEAYREAEVQLREQAQKMGIANESRQSAVKLLTPFMKALGFKKISIKFKAVGELKDSNNKYIR